MDLTKRATAAGLNRTTVYLLVLVLVLSVLHHTDHALRVDHSGWPLRSAVTPFTYSLLVYPMILFALFGPRNWYWLRWGLLAAGCGFVLYAHIAVETPYAQFAMWAHNESVHEGAHVVHNAFNIESPVLGIGAAMLSMALNIVAVVATLSMLVNGLRPSLKQRDTISF